MIGLLAIALAALAGDQLTKHIVASHLTLDAERHVAGPLSIHHVQNSGIAFGLFASATPIVTILTAVAVAWMLVFFARSGSRHPILPAALGLLIGGSASNLLDRIRLGHVTDFIDLRFWPAFNLVTASSSSASSSCTPRCSSRNARRSGRVRFPTLTLRVPQEAAGARLDRFLAEVPEIGSRSAAERLVEGGNVRVDGRARPKSHRLEGGEELEVELPPEPSREIEPERSISASRTRTSTCSSWTSPPASSCIRVRATRRARSSTGSPAGPRVGRRTGPESSTGSIATRPGCSS